VLFFMERSVDSSKLLEVARAKLKELVEVYKFGIHVERVEAEVRKNVQRVAELANKFGLSPKTAAAVLLALAMSRVHWFAYVPEQGFYDLTVREIDAVVEVLEKLGFEPVGDDCMLNVADMLTNTEWSVAERVAADNHMRLVVIGWPPVRFTLTV